MAVTRSMTSRLNHDASGHKRSKTVDQGSSAPWSQLFHDVLLLVIMKLGTIDFVSFSCVCKSWRAFARSNWYRFMSSRDPVKLAISTGANKECLMEDHEGRKFRTFIPHSTGSTCVGLTRGYLILFGRRTRNFWLVNPVTRHEFHFPRLTYPIGTDPTRFRGILFRSPLLSKWVFIISLRSSNVVSFSVAGSEVWSHLSSDFPIHDIHEFQGKIFTLNTGGRLYEVAIKLDPTLTPLGLKVLQRNLTLPQLVSSGENLRMMYWLSDETVCIGLQLDFEKLRWVKKETLAEHAWFVSNFNCAALTKLHIWDDPQILHERFGYHLGTKINKKEASCFTAVMWYFPHDCLNFSLLQ